MSTENTPPSPEQPTPAAPPAPTPAAPPVASAPTAPPAAPAGTALPQGAKPGGPPPHGGKGPPRPGAPNRGPGGPNRGPRGGGDRPNRSDKPYNQGGMPPVMNFEANKPNNRELDKLIEDELAAAMGDFDVTKTIAQAETVQKPGAPGKAGGRRTGVIVGVHGNDVFVEVPGGRSQGVLPLQQFEGRKPVVGEAVEFDIDHYDAANGLLILTREGSTQIVHDWSQVAYGMIVEARVTGTNKNKTGLTVEVNGIKGFLPASQLDMYRVENIEQFLNQRLKVMVAEVNPEERNLIVSRRAVQEKEKQAKAEEFWKNVQEGQVRKGIVRSIKPFGAFVDLGGADGLIPASEFSWQRVNNLEEFVKIGQEVEVLINRIDFEARKIGLSMKQLTVSPFEEFAKVTKSGARVQGKVSRIADFGAFVELAPGVEGLIHVSELSSQRVRRVRDIVSEGQSVTVEILSVDPGARRISLSLKRIEQETEDAEDAAAQAEHEAAMKAAEEAMANRPVNPNLRGGLGGPIKFDAEG